MYEDSIGPHGIPARIAYDDDNDGYFEIEERHDYAAATLERWQEEQSKNSAREPGTFPVVKYTRPQE